MFNIDKFIADSVTFRPVSMFAADIEANKEVLTREIRGKKVCVIGGAGSIGSSFIKAVLRFEPKSVVVVDLNENGLAELVRDVRSTEGLYVPDEFRCYTLNFADPIFTRIFREEKGFDIVANFSAHKHVRSEKDKYSVQALIENNDIKAKKLMDLLCECPPKHFFCVSTDKAANPVNIMGAINYMLDDEKGFKAFLTDGAIELSNDDTERMFRHIAMGRRNWLHIGSHMAAQNVAFMYSLYESCRLNNINFGKYLNDILTRMMKGDTNYMAMLPCNYVAQEHEDELKVKECA